MFGRLGLEAGIDWKEGDAQQLPFDDQSFDAYTVAFGVRNVVNIEAALSEAYRSLVTSIRTSEAGKSGR